MASSRSSSDIAMSTEDENIEVDIDYSEFSEDGDLESEFRTMSDPGFHRHKQMLYQIWPPFAENHVKDQTSESLRNAHLPEHNKKIDDAENNQSLANSQYNRTNNNLKSLPEAPKECDAKKNNLMLLQTNAADEDPKKRQLREQRKRSAQESNLYNSPTNYDIMSIVILANQELELRGFPHIDWVERLTDKFGYFLTDADIQRFYKTFKWEDEGPGESGPQT